MVEFAPVRPARTFEVISDQIREQVRTGALKSGDKLPPERVLATQFGTSRNAVREALRSLEHAGLIERERRGREHRIRVDPRPLREVRTWMEAYARLWEDQFDALDRYLRDAQRRAERNPDEKENR